MYAFFATLYMALFTGEWVGISTTDASNSLKTLLNDLGRLLVNALGGEFAQIQTFTFSLTAPLSVSLALALITYCMICFAVFGLVKKIFTIFFSGVR